MNNGSPTEWFNYSYDNVGDLKAAVIPAGVANLNSYYSETYNYDRLYHEDAFTRGSPVAGSPPGGSDINISWQGDSEGNKFSTLASGKYGTGYAGSNQKTASGNLTGNQVSVALSSGNVTVTYDAWGRVASTVTGLNLGNLPSTNTHISYGQKNQPGTVRPGQQPNIGG